MTFLEKTFESRLKLEKGLTDLEEEKLLRTSPFETLTRRIRYWNDSRMILCKLRTVEVKANVYEAKLNARKTVHEYKDKMGNIFRPLSWHKLIPEPDS